MRKPCDIEDGINTHLSRIDAVADLLWTVGGHRVLDEVSDSTITALMMDVCDSVKELRRLTDELQQRHQGGKEVRQ